MVGQEGGRRRGGGMVGQEGGRRGGQEVGWWDRRKEVG